jgi:hypothetical protein
MIDRLDNPLCQLFISGIPGIMTAVHVAISSPFDIQQTSVTPASI